MDAISEEHTNERWYIAVRARGFPTEIVNRAFDLIPRFGLQNFITRVSHERDICKRGEFYLFLGVISPRKGYIPPDILDNYRNFLSSSKLLDQNIYLSYDEIKQMASKEIEGRNYRQLRMAKPHKQFLDNPFSVAGDRQVLRREYSKQYNHLLRWLSAVSSGSWSLYTNTCRALGLSESGSDAGRIIRRLETLGHVEMYANRRKWITAPSCLVEFARSQEGITYFLAGRRSEAMLDLLQHQMGIVECFPQPEAPDRILVTFYSEKEAGRAANQVSQTEHRKLSLAGNAALQLAVALPPLREWPTLLQSLDNMVLSSYRYKRWDQRQGFIPIDGIPRETGFYELERSTNAQYKPVFTAFFDAESNRWFRGDWYGLRFLYLSYEANATLEVHYDSATKRLAIHRDTRWPHLYERALVLASGLLPAEDERGWLFFENVSADLANLLTNKLNIELTLNSTG